MAAPPRSRMVSREVRLRRRRAVDRALERAARAELERYVRLRGARGKAQSIDTVREKSREG